MNEIVEQKNFQEQMIERIKDSIGELMTNEELSKIVKQAMKEIFFKPMQLSDGRRTKETPPFIHQLIKELLTKEVSLAIDKFLFENKDYVTEKIKETLQQGMGMALVNVIKNQFNGDLMNFQHNLMTNIQNR